MSQINETIVCLLREHPQTGQLQYHTEDVQTPLNSYWEEISPLFDNDSISGTSLFERINTHPHLKVIFKFKDYCLYLSSPDGYIDGNLNKISEVFRHRSKSSLKEYALNHLKAHHLDFTYQQLAHDKSILSISHRKNGWRYRINFFQQLGELNFWKQLDAPGKLQFIPRTEERMEWAKSMLENKKSKAEKHAE